MCTFADMLAMYVFPWLIKGCAFFFFIVFVVCYFIKVCFKMVATVYAALCACEHTSMCGLCGCVHMFQPTCQTQTRFHF